MNARHLVSSLILTGLLSCLVAPGGAAQPAGGQIVLTASGPQGGLFYINQPQPLPIRFLRPITSGSFGCVKMACGNASVYCVPLSCPIRVVNIFGSGSSFDVIAMSVPTYPTGIAIDQDGSYWMSCHDRIVRLGNGNLDTPVTQGGRKWVAICRDKDTGDFVVADYQTGELHRIERRTKGLSVLASGLSQYSLTGVAYIPRTGGFAVSRLNSPYGLLILDRFGRVTKQVAISGATAVTVDEQNSDICVATGFGEVMCTTYYGSVRWTRDFGDQRFTGIDVWGDQGVTLEASGRRGYEQKVTLGFPQSTSKPYACALSLGIRPGLPFAGSRYLNLAPDGLFCLTAGRDIPGFTRGFAGTTSASWGQAEARFTLPKTVPIGTRIYFAAAAMNPAFPGSVDLSNTEVVKVWDILFPIPYPIPKP
jgi:hypothetical protein